MTALGATGCAHPRPAAPASPPPLQTLRSAGASRGILAGCAVQVRHLRDTPAYADLVREQAGIIVEESALKFGPLRPSPDAYFFDYADYLFDFAQTNNMQVRGHNFVWHRQLPRWFESYVTPANAEKVLVEHIERVGGRYAGRVHSWDVVNEAVQVKDGLPGGLRNSPWQNVLGSNTAGGDAVLPAYIEIAFRTARRVDPRALLFYNDYGIEAEDEASEAKRRAVMQLLRTMQQRGVPLDGLGIQSHISAGSREASGPAFSYGPGLMKMIAEARAMGLKVMLTEMDVNDRHLPADIATRDAAVAAVYGSYLRQTLADPAVIGLLTWGITDRYTWLNGEDSREDKQPERCLPFDADFAPKQAFRAEVDAVLSSPRR